MGKMVFSDEARESDYAFIWSEGGLIHAGMVEPEYFGTHSVIFHLPGTVADTMPKRDMMLIWDQKRHMVIFPDKLGNIRACSADWIQGDEYLEWDESRESAEVDVIIPKGTVPGIGTIADKLDELVLSDKSAMSEEIATKVAEMVSMVQTWDNSDI